MLQQQRTCLYLFDMCLPDLQKYRVRFLLDKYESLKGRVGSVGHDIMQDGHAPEQSKLNMCNNWTVPESGKFLHSFIGLINFYFIYAPYFEIRLKPLRKLCKRHFRQPITELYWTPQLNYLF